MPSYVLLLVALAEDRPDLLHEPRPIAPKWKPPGDHQRQVRGGLLPPEHGAASYVALVAVAHMLGERDHILPIAETDVHGAVVRIGVVVVRKVDVHRALDIDPYNEVRMPISDPMPHGEEIHDFHENS